MSNRTSLLVNYYSGLRLLGQRNGRAVYQAAKACRRIEPTLASLDPVALARLMLGNVTWPLRRREQLPHFFGETHADHADRQR
jgi:hypothetical protein